MCCHHLLDCQIFSSWISFFIEKGIVVIRCNLWQIQSPSSRATIHETKVCTTMEHVKIDGALLQTSRTASANSFRIPSDDRFFPTVEPTIPEFHTHEGPFLPYSSKNSCICEKLYGALEPKVPCHKEVIFDQGSGLQSSSPWTI